MLTQDQVANVYRISQSLISKWYIEKDSIIAAVTNKHKTLFAKQGKCTKYSVSIKPCFKG